MAPSSFAPLRHRSYALMWSGAFVSNLGTWMETVALGYYVTEVTRQAAWTGLIAAASFVPIALVGPVGGALADRWSRRHLMAVTTLAQAVLAGVLTLLVIADHAPPWVVVVLALASGCAGALGFPAYQAMLPDLVPEEDLVAAIGLGSAQYNLGRVIGPALAGVVIKLGGVEWALGINAVSFLAVVTVLLVVRLPKRAPSRAPLLAAIRDGWRFAHSEPGIRVSLSVMALTMFLASPFIALLPAMAVNVLDGDEATTAALVTAQGIGAVVAALSLGRLNARFGVRRMMVGAVAALPLALLAYATAPVLAVTLLTLMVLGAVYLMALSSFTTVAQQRSPDHLRGRVLAINMVTMGVLYPVGALLQGRLADGMGLRVVTAAAALSMAVVLAAVRLVRPGATSALDDPVARRLADIPA
ncbi:MAG TPA: MFS transporter [Acidimicrobiales bacterium]